MPKRSAQLEQQKLKTERNAALAKLVFQAALTLGHNMDAELGLSTAEAINRAIPHIPASDLEQCYDVLIVARVKARARGPISAIDFDEAYEQIVAQRDASAHQSARERRLQLERSVVAEILESVSQRVLDDTKKGASQYGTADDEESAERELSNGSD